MRHPRRTELAAARSAAAYFARRLCRVFARGFAKLRVDFPQSIAINFPSTVLPNLEKDLDSEKRNRATVFYRAALPAFVLSGDRTSTSWARRAQSGRSLFGGT